MMLLALFLLGTVPVEISARDTADMIEVNHLYDEQGRIVFDQVIYWDEHNGRLRVKAWRLLKKPSQSPALNRQIYLEGILLRHIRSRLTIETWTQFDPEILNRQCHPQHKRPDLIKIIR